MSMHINRFIDRIKAAESRNQKDLTMSMNDARDLHGDITKLLNALQAYHEKSQAAPEVIQVEIGGGTF